MFHIAIGQAEAGDVKGALETAGSIQRKHTRATALRAIAVAQAEAGNIRGALQTSATILDEFFKASSLAYVAHALVEGLTLLSTDRQFSRYAAPVVW